MVRNTAAGRAQQLVFVWGRVTSDWRLKGNHGYRDSYSADRLVYVAR
jgi:hypothetical protein